MLVKQKVLIIGGTSGFGFQLAQQVLIKHAIVTITGRNLPKLIAAKEKLNDIVPDSQITGFIFDTNDSNSYNTLLTKVNTVDHVVSTLGGAMNGGFLKNSVADIRQAIEDKFFTNLILGQKINLQRSNI
jgi:short-subunit dehydrogenase